MCCILFQKRNAWLLPSFGTIEVLPLPSKLFQKFTNWQAKYKGNFKYKVSSYEV